MRSGTFNTPSRQVDRRKDTCCVSCMNASTIFVHAFNVITCNVCNSNCKRTTVSTRCPNNVVSPSFILFIIKLNIASWFSRRLTRANHGDVGKFPAYTKCNVECISLSIHWLQYQSQRHTIRLSDEPMNTISASASSSVTKASRVADYWPVNHKQTHVQTLLHDETLLYNDKARNFTAGVSSQ